MAKRVAKGLRCPVCGFLLRTYRLVIYEGEHFRLEYNEGGDLWGGSFTLSKHPSLITTPRPERMVELIDSMVSDLKALKKALRRFLKERGKGRRWP